MEVLGTPFVPIGDNTGYYIQRSDVSVSHDAFSFQRHSGIIGYDNPLLVFTEGT